MGKGDRRRAYTLTSPVAMHTADREVSAEKGVVMKPFGDMLDVDCYILPQSPSLLSVGNLSVEADFDFSWPRGQKPWLTFPDGTPMQLQVVNRVPIWPMTQGRRNQPAGLACPTLEGGLLRIWGCDWGTGASNIRRRRRRRRRK